MHKTICRFFLLGTFILCLTALTIRSSVLFRSQHYNSAAEAVGLHGILDVADRIPLYKTQQQHPFSIFVFTPIHAELTGRLLRLFNIQDLEARVFFIKSLHIFLAVILFSLLFFNLPESKSNSLFAFFLVIILSSSKIFDYIATTRNDIFSLLIEVTVFTFFSRFIKNRTIRNLMAFVIFASLSVWVRQTAFVVFFAGLVWLLLNKEFRKAGLCLLSWSALNLMILFVCLTLYGVSFWDHILFSNMRLWKPLDKSLFSLSLFSFAGCLLTFFYLLGLTLKSDKFSLESIQTFRWLCILFGFGLGMTTYFRAGGDVNYLFLPLLLSTLVLFPSLNQILESNQGKSLIAIQLLFISGVFFYKATSSLSVSQLPYDHIAKQIRLQFPQGGLATGHLSQGLLINLRGWAYHGPEITSGCMISQSSHPRLHWLLRDAEEAAKTPQIQAVVHADRGCATLAQPNDSWAKDFSKKSVWNDWLCVYTRPN